MMVFCRDCEYKWITTTDAPVCPKCKGVDIAEHEWHTEEQAWFDTLVSDDE